MPSDDRLERLWNATRPDTPSAEVWDRAWTEVVGRLDDPAATDHPPLTLAVPSPRPRRWAVAGLVLFAQAAAVLLAVGLAMRDAAKPEPGAGAGASSQTNTAIVRIEEGQLVLIRSDADALQVADLSPDVGPAGVDAWYLVYNLLESMAGPVIAMSE